MKDRRRRPWQRPHGGPARARAGLHLSPSRMNIRPRRALTASPTSASSATTCREQPRRDGTPQTRPTVWFASLSLLRVWASPTWASTTLTFLFPLPSPAPSRHIAWGRSCTPAAARTPCQLPMPLTTTGLQVTGAAAVPAHCFAMPVSPNDLWFQNKRHAMLANARRRAFGSSSPRHLRMRRRIRNSIAIGCARQAARSHRRIPRLPRLMPHSLLSAAVSASFHVHLPDSVPSRGCRVGVGAVYSHPPSSSRARRRALRRPSASDGSNAAFRYTRYASPTSPSVVIPAHRALMRSPPLRQTGIDSPPAYTVIGRLADLDRGNNHRREERTPDPQRRGKSDPSSPSQ